MVEIRHYSPGSLATRCWYDVDDYCPRKPVVRVTTEVRSRHLCVLHYDAWKRGVRELVAAFGEWDARGTDGVPDDGQERQRRRAHEELAAILADEAKEKVRHGL